MLRAFNPAGGGGGGGVSGTGTPNKVAKWTLANTIGDSLLSDDGAQIYTTANFGVGAAVGTGLAIGSLTLAPAVAATTGTYSQVALGGGSGTGATADVVVTSSVITSIVLRSPGQGYAVGDTLTCTAVGAGAGVTVATVATVTNYAGVTGDLYATRIGAGTTRPLAPAHVIGGAFLSSSGDVTTPSATSTTPRFVRSNLIVDSSAEVGGAATVSNSNLQFTGIYTNINVDTSAWTTTKTAYGVDGIINLSNGQSTGTTGIVGVRGYATAGSAISGKTFTMTGLSGQTFVGNSFGAGNTLTSMHPVASSNILSASSAATVTTMTNFTGSSSISGAAHTITNFYGLRLLGASLSGGATITNRWGISQEDTLATNLFAGVSIIGSGEASASPVGQTLRGPSGSGSNIAGGSITIAGGNSTGSGAGGSIVFQTAAAGGAGSGANTLTTRASIDSAGNLAFNSGFGSAATAYGCRAWVNFNGTGTVAIRSSGNVTSITDNGVGDYTVNMTNAMSDANYAIACSVGGTNGVDIIRPRDESTARTTTAFRLLVMTNAFAPGDSAVVNAMVVR